MIFICLLCNSSDWPQGPVLPKLTSRLLDQISWWELESHRQTCLSYPQVRNWGFQGWMAKPHNSSVWPCRKEEKETKLIKLISKLLFWGCAKHLNTSCCNLIKHIHLFIKIWFSSAWTWDELVVGSKERKKKEPSYWTANVEINLTAACTCVMGMNSPSKLPFKTKFFVVPMSTLSPLPSAIVRMGPNNSGTCREKAAIMHSTASPGT